MTTLSIVIPAYNEEDGIRDIVERVLSTKKDLTRVGVNNLELIVVNDCSKDKTAEIAHSIEGVTLINHSQNRGYGAALKTGFSNAKGELIGFLDADGTYPPEYFPRLCEAALNGAELVIGSRMAGEDSQMPLVRRIGNLFFANLLSIISHRRVTDSASGQRVFKKELLERIYPLPDGLNLTPIMSVRAIHEHVKMVEIPIPYSERQGRSKLSVVNDGLLFLHSIIWTALTYNPVRLLGIIGLFLLGIALFIGLKMVISRFSGVTSLEAWEVVSLFVGAVAALTGISLFALGITFNYLVALFNKKNIRQGLFGRPIFNPPLDQHFGWMGIILLLGGLLIGGVGLGLGLNGWEISRLWLYLLTSAMIILIGVQLIIYWVILRVLDELTQREFLVQKDLALNLSGNSHDLDLSHQDMNNA